MPIYFDSSVVVSLITSALHSVRAFELWQAESHRVSSSLLTIECMTVPRRLSFANPSLARDAEARLALVLEEVTMKHVDGDVVQMVRQTPGLARCRALDAVHLATALHFASFADEPFALATFDGRMAEVAVSVGLRVSAAS